MGTGRKDVYDLVTAQIIADLEKGVRTWLKPWDAGHMAGKVTCPLRSSGEPYKGINVLMLWASAAAQGFPSPYWMTFKQAKGLGGCVRKGSKGSMVVYANRMTKTETGADGTETGREVYFMKSYTAFNAGQVDGLPDHFYATPAPEAQGRLASADGYFAATEADIRHGGNSAYYSQSSDHVQLPPFDAFQDKESYYATLAHEMTHWTKHPGRLDRDFGRKRFGDEGYAREELVAEIGAAFLCCGLGITPTPREDHAAYLQHWIDVLKADNRAIFRAAAHAQRAADYLDGLQPQPAHGLGGSDRPGQVPHPTLGQGQVPSPSEVIANPTHYLPELVNGNGNDRENGR